MALATRVDVEIECGADQLCSGAKAGIKAAVHAVKDTFELDETEAILMVDASNAFNAGDVVELPGPMAKVLASSSTVTVDMPSLSFEILRGAQPRSWSAGKAQRKVVPLQC